MRIAGIFAALVTLLTGSIPQGPHRVHVDGQRAFELISLLVSGSDALRKVVTETDQQQGRFTFRDLNVLASATYKYDSDRAAFKLDLYRAFGKLNGSQQESDIGEATSLWKLLTTLGFKPGGALEGGYLEIQTLDCTIDVHAAFSAAKRFQCDIVGAY